MLHTILVVVKQRGLVREGAGYAANATRNGKKKKREKGGD
jgi:hypothetical protein